MMRRTALCLICGLGQLAAQNPTFRAQSDVVTVPVTVTDKHGKPVEGLSAADFKLLDNGLPREINLDVFDTGVAPISLAIAVQSAGISTPALKKIRRIGSMIQPLITGARGAAAVITFDSQVHWVQDFTSDSGALRDAIEDIRPFPNDQARMLDAIGEAADRMKDRKGRKVLLLISETRDRGSKVKLAQAMEALQRGDIEVFAAHYSAYGTAFASKPEDLQQLHDARGPSTDGPDPPPMPNPGSILAELARLGKTNAIQALTQATGGSDFPFTTEKGVERSMENLGVAIHSQYILSFRAPPDASGEHRIEVTVPEHPEYRVRSRQDYWARQ